MDSLNVSTLTNVPRPRGGGGTSYYWATGDVPHGVAFSGTFNRVIRMGSQFFETLRVRKSLAQK